MNGILIIGLMSARMRKNTRYAMHSSKLRWLGNKARACWHEKAPVKQCPKGRIRFYSRINDDNPTSVQISGIMQRTFAERIKKGVRGQIKLYR